MEPSNTQSHPKHSNHLMGLQPQDISEFDPFRNDILLLETMITSPINNNPPITAPIPSPKLEQPDLLSNNHSSLSLSYAELSTTNHSDSALTHLYTYSPYIPSSQNPNYTDYYELISRRVT